MPAVRVAAIYPHICPKQRIIFLFKKEIYMKNFKRVIAAAACAATAAVMCATMLACGDGADANPESVKLFSVAATDVGAPGIDADYFVAAEPAATTRANATGLKFAGDLQELYGAEGGYPQAVLVAKNELVESNPAFLSAFIAEVEENASWLATATAKTIIDTVASHLPADTTPTFTEKNLNATVIANCGINFVSAAQDKQRVNDFIEEMAEVDPSSVGTITDSFFCGTLGTASQPSEISVYMPDGAPALALAKLMNEENQFGQTSVEYNVVPADTIGAQVNGADPAADICVLPVNAASKLLGSGEKYKMLGTVTNGNLYLLTEDGESITEQNVSPLAGKKIGVINLANVPGLTLKIILNKYDVAFETLQ